MTDMKPRSKDVTDGLSSEKPAAWKLKAYKYYYIPWQDAGIVVEPTADLIRYQRLIDGSLPLPCKPARPRHW